MIELAKKAKQASLDIASLDAKTKNKALEAIAKALDDKRKEIIAANRKDLDKAEKDKISAVLLKRLNYDNKKIDESIAQIDELIKMDDPIGKELAKTELDKGLILTKESCPIGVIGVIFESRPDALVQIATLCLKSADAVIMKGGKEGKNTNEILAEIIKQAADSVDISLGNFLTLIETREDVKELLKLDEYIDLMIPRGSNELVRFIKQNTKIAVLGHSDGICHIYVDKEADMKKAEDIVIDAKTQYSAVCNAVETLLIDENIAGVLLPVIVKALLKKDVELRLDNLSMKIIQDAKIKDKKIRSATDKDWSTEYNDLILSVKVVKDINEAIAHINKYGSHHTDAIITENSNKAEFFMDNVDSSSVFVNCSTRFADGFRYGLGAEVGISTSKIHARGPVGLEGLSIYKWKLRGKGQIVKDYADGKSSFRFRKIK